MGQEKVIEIITSRLKKKSVYQILRSSPSVPRQTLAIERKGPMKKFTIWSVDILGTTSVCIVESTPEK